MEVLTTQDVYKENVLTSPCTDDKSLFASQLGIRPETGSPARALEIISSIPNQGIITLKVLRRFEVQKYGEQMYIDPTLMSFKRIRSNGEVAQCYLVLEGHHRIAAAKLLGISLECKVIDGPSEPLDIRNYEVLKSLQREKVLRPSIQYIVGFNKITRDFRQSYEV